MASPSMLQQILESLWTTKLPDIPVIDEFLALHNERDRAIILQLLRRFPDPKELPILLNETLTAPRDSHICCLQEVLREEGISPEPDPPLRTSIMNLVVSITRGTTSFMTNMSLTQLILIGGILSAYVFLRLPATPVPTLPLPPAFPFDEILNETIRRGEAAAAARLAPPAEPFKMHKLSRQSDTVLEHLRNLSSTFQELDYTATAPATVPKADRDRYWKNLLEVQNVFGVYIRGDLYSLDGLLSSTFRAIRTRLDNSALALGEAAKMPAEIWVIKNARFAQWLPKRPSRFAVLLEWAFGPDDGKQASLEQQYEEARDAILWTDVCTSRAYILEKSDELIKRCVFVQRELGDMEQLFNPVHQYVQTEVVSRLHRSKADILELRRTYNDTLQAWNQYKVNRWTESNWALQLIAWVFRGQAKPIWPDSLLRVPIEVRERMETVEGELVLVRAHVDTLLQALVDAKQLLEGKSKDGKELGAGSAATICERKGQGMAVSEKVSVQKTLLDLDNAAVYVHDKVREWNEEDFHDHIQVLRTENGV